MACFRLFTLPPFPPFPDRNVPFFFRRIALSTLRLAAFPYFRLDEDFFLLAGIVPSCRLEFVSRLQVGHGKPSNW